jgi:uncharacterized repeat protein (TIGR01451 family)
MIRVTRIEGLEVRCLLSTFDVTSAADSGPGTLRQAIVDASNTPGANDITFHIGTGPQSIPLQSPLPYLSTTVTVDGTTQPGYSGTPLIELNGSQAGNPASGLTITAPNVVVRGLAINRFLGHGIALVNTGGDTIQGDYIGTDVSGEIALGNSLSGIALSNAKGNTIGGLTAGSGNLISNNGQNGISFYNGSSGNVVQGNLIGVDASGQQAESNGSDGIGIFDSRGETIGGATPAARNVISGNSVNGIEIATSNTSSGAADGTVIQGNDIGTNATGDGALGNSSNGISIDSSFNVVGGPTSAQGNTIAYNRQAGVTVAPSFSFPGLIGNQILSNSIHDNALKGISIGFPVSQNPPQLTEAYNSTGNTTVEGRLFGTPSTPYTLQFFANTGLDAGGFGEGETLLGTKSITTDGTGEGDFTILLSQAVSPGHLITATATGPGNSTSTFSNAVPIYPSPAADLAAFLSTSAGSVLVGSPLVYTATASNFGPSTATNVILTDQLPEGVTVVSAQSASGPCTVSDGQVVCNAGTLARGQQAQVTIIVQPSAPGVLNNEVSVKGDQFDTNERNNTASAATLVNTATFNLAVNQSAVPSPAVVLGAVTYTINVTNFGPDPAPNAILTDTLPADVTLVSATTPIGTVTPTNGQVVVSLGTIGPGSVLPITIVVAPSVAVAPNATGSIVNVVNVQGSGNEINPNDNTASLTTAVQADYTSPEVTHQRITVTPRGITNIILSFSKALDPSTATDPANYTVRTPGPDNIFLTPDDQNVPIKSLVYNSAMNTLTITPQTPLKLAHFYRLAVGGPGAPGVTDPSGNVLNGDVPYVSYISRGTHLRPDTDPRILRLPQFNAGHRLPHPPKHVAGS